MRAGSQTREETADSQIVDVMSRLLAERPVLSEAGQTGIHETRVMFETEVRTQTHPLHDPRAVRLYDDVTGLYESQEERGALPPLQVQSDGALASVQSVHVVRRAPVHPDDVTAVVGQNETRERDRGQPRHLQHPDTSQSHANMINQCTGKSNKECELKKVSLTAVSCLSGKLCQMIGS